MNISNIILIGFLTLLLASFLSCSSKKPITQVPADEVMYGLRKGACFGRCPIFKLSIYSDGHALLEAQKFMDNLGKFEKKLTKLEMENLGDLFSSSKFHDFPDTFPSLIADLPSVWITHHNGETSKTIFGKEDRPDQLLNLERALQQIVQSKGWELVESYETTIPDKVKVEKVYNQLIVQPLPGKMTETWFSKYKKYGLKKVRKISPDLEYYVIEFNSKSIDPDQMLEKIKSDPIIRLVEFNKEIKNRR